VNKSFKIEVEDNFIQFVEDVLVMVINVELFISNSLLLFLIGVLVLLYLISVKIEVVQDVLLAVVAPAMVMIMELFIYF